MRPVFRVAARFCASAGPGAGMGLPGAAGDGPAGPQIYRSVKSDKSAICGVSLCTYVPEASRERGLQKLLLTDPFAGEPAGAKPSIAKIHPRPFLYRKTEPADTREDKPSIHRRFKHMKATGIVRRIDDLGRVVIPKEIRRTLRIREGNRR